MTVCQVLSGGENAKQTNLTNDASSQNERHTFALIHMANLRHGDVVNERLRQFTAPVPPLLLLSAMNE